MLFDLSSPGRKTVIRIVYGTLALLFLVGFVGFGIGGELGGGGLIDSITGNGGGSTADQYEQQIEDAEEKLEADPQNSAALANLAQYRFLSGQVQLEYNEETGEVTGVTEEARGEFEAAVDAWNRYLDADPKTPDVTTATNVVQAYVYLNDVEGAADTQEILAEAKPGVQAYATLAYYRYVDFDLKAGDEAAELAVAEAKPDERKQVERQLAGLHEQAEKAQKQLEKQPDSATGEGTGLDNPFGGLSPEGTGGALPPTAP